MSLPADFYDDTAPRDPVPDPLDQDADDPFYTLHMVHSEMRRRDADPSSELQCPNAPTMRRLVEEYRGWWLDQHGQYGHTDMLKYAYERLVHGPVYRPNVTPEQFLVYETFTELMENEQEFFFFLKSILVHVGMVGEEGDADVHASREGVLRANATVRMYYDAVARMLWWRASPSRAALGVPRGVRHRTRWRARPPCHRSSGRRRASRAASRRTWTATRRRTTTSRTPSSRCATSWSAAASAVRRTASSRASRRPRGWRRTRTPLP